MQAVNARVDDGRALGGWRNTLNFDPAQRYGRFSYEEAILNPLADAMIQVNLCDCGRVVDNNNNNNNNIGVGV